VCDFLDFRYVLRIAPVVDEVAKSAGFVPGYVRVVASHPAFCVSHEHRGIQLFDVRAPRLLGFERRFESRVLVVKDEFGETGRPVHCSFDRAREVRRL
jgi:hypothetical protein